MPIATGCWARFTRPTTRFRTRCFGPGAGCPSSRGQSSLWTWLYRIATNVCLDAIARRPKRVLPIDHGPPSPPGTSETGRPLSERLWIEPYPDEALGLADGAAAPEARYERREALELALVAALKHLPPRQRGALILRDVLGFSARDAAESLETTVASVNGAVRRARAAIEERRPDRSQQATLRALGDRRLREIVKRFADAFERGEIDAIRAMLASRQMTGRRSRDTRAAQRTRTTGGPGRPLANPRANEGDG
jgi:RNA polymerase sigma-70 factor, ECF subfamily